MLRSAALLCVFTVSAFGAWEGGLVVRHSSNPLFGDGFLPLPTSDIEAVRRGWSPIQAPAGRPVQGLLGNLTLFTDPNDPAMGIFCDDTGYIAGLNIGIYTNSFYGGLNDSQMIAQGHTKWTILINGVNTTLWTTQIYYVTPEFLEIPSAERIRNRNHYVLLQDKEVLVPFNGSLYSISTHINQLSNPAGDWNRQACIRFKGRIYTYKITRTTELTPETLLPFFAMTYDNQLVGIGWYNPGRYAIFPETDPRTNYMENKERQEVVDAITNGPQWLYDLPNTQGLTCLHTYVIKHPYQMTCLFN